MPFSIACKQVDQRNPFAVEVLRLCAYLSPEAILQEILTQGTIHLGEPLASIAGDGFVFNQVVEALRAYSFVDRDSARKTLSMHRLVHPGG